MRTPRRRAREMAVQALYQSFVSGISVNEAAANIREMGSFGKTDETLFDNLVGGTSRHAGDYIRLIRPLLDRDEKDLSPVERAVLLTACHELSAMPETPYPVIINEAIEVTKTFGGTDGHKFVNGILDRLAAELRPNDPKRGA